MHAFVLLLAGSGFLFGAFAAPQDLPLAERTPSSYPSSTTTLDYVLPTATTNVVTGWQKNQW